MVDNKKDIKTSNWANELTFGIEDIQHKLEDAKQQGNKNPEVKEKYDKAMESIKQARHDISGFVGAYNKT